MALRRHQAPGRFVLAIAVGAVISACGPTGTAGPGSVNARSAPVAPVTGPGTSSTSTREAPAGTPRAATANSAAANSAAANSATASTRPGPGEMTGVVPPRVAGATPPTTIAVGAAALAGGAAISCGGPSHITGPEPQCPPG